MSQFYIMQIAEQICIALHDYCILELANKFYGAPRPVIKRPPQFVFTFLEKQYRRFHMQGASGIDARFFDTNINLQKHLKITTD
jgi:hypothetical protein